MSRFHTTIRLRWADLDAFRHVNHARTVTLLEEARVELVFRLGSEYGVGDWSEGLLVTSLHVDYHAQIPYWGQSVRVGIWAHQVRAASFLLDYEVRTGRPRTTRWRPPRGPRWSRSTYPRTAHVGSPRPSGSSWSKWQDEEADHRAVTDWRSTAHPSVAGPRPPAKPGAAVS